MYDSHGKTGFSQKCLQMGYTWVCYHEPESKRESIEWKHIDSSKKKFRNSNQKNWWFWQS